MRIPLTPWHIERRKDGSVWFAKRGKPQKYSVGAMPSGGRSSVVTDGGIFSTMFTGTIEPTVALEFIPVIKGLCHFNPDYNQTHGNLITNANTGHDLIITEGSDTQVEKAFDLLNACSKRIFPYGNGVDGLINHLLGQEIVTGAISAEAVLDEGFNQVERVVTVPVEQIRFKRGENGTPEPYQKVNQLGNPEGLVKLNPLTYKYMAVETAENNPYAIPPFLSALEWTKIQRKVFENIEFIVKKLGLLGLITVKANPLQPRGGESDSEYEKRNAEKLQEYADKMSPDFYNGLMVYLDDLEIELHQLSGEGGKGLNGAVVLIHHIEQMIFSGLGSDPAMHGRSYSTTETYAKVTYDKMIRRAQFFRQLVKLFIEHVYSLELILQGAGDLRAEIEFIDNEPFDAEKAAKAERENLETAIRKAEVGMADPDFIAQQEGFEGWHDQTKIGGEKVTSLAERKKVRARYNPEKTQYVYTPEQIILSQRSAEEQTAIEGWVSTYLQRIQPLNESWQQAAQAIAKEFFEKYDYTDFANAEGFAERFIDELRTQHKIVFESAKVKEEISESIENLYRNFRLSDAFVDWGDVIPDLKLTGKDTITVEFIKSLDRFYFSKFFDNENYLEPLKKQIIEAYIQGGAGLFGRGTSEEYLAFRTIFGDQLAYLDDVAVNRIIDTSVMRMRNWAHLEGFHQAGIEEVYVWNPMDEDTSDICRQLNGKIIKVELAYNQFQEQLTWGIEQYADFLKTNRLTAGYIEELFEAYGEDEQGAMDKLANDGVGWPPYHVKCRSRANRRRKTSRSLQETRIKVRECQKKNPDLKSLAA